MPKQGFEQWVAAAKDLPEEKARTTVPFRVLTNEALAVAGFFERHWKKKKRGEDGYGLPSLDLAGKKLPASMGDEILSLREAAEKQHARYLLAASKAFGGDDALVERAQQILDDTTAVLEWHFDDGKEDERDEQLARVKSEHANDDGSPLSLSNELTDYLTLARAYKGELDGLGDYDVKLIDEGEALVEKLRAAHGAHASEDKLEVVKQERDLRNRLAVLLQQRMQLVRSAARFVYRNHPSVVREVTSAYERRKRAAARRASKKASGDTGAQGG